MDTFITTAMVIYDNINNELQTGPRLINNKITEKQFLAYYIYRIWIKYRKLMEDANTPSDIRRVLKYMEVPKKYHEIYLTYPMANKMPINEKQLDLIILSMLKQLNQTYKIYGQRADGSIPPENKDYKMLNKYLTGKTIENIIQDVIQIKLLVPNLSRPANVRNIWDGIDQMLDDIDVIDPVNFENSATEIPDTKLIENKSPTSDVSNISNSDIMPIKTNSMSINNKLLNNKPLNNTPKQNMLIDNSKPSLNSNGKPSLNSNGKPSLNSNGKPSLNSNGKPSLNSNGKPSLNSNGNTITNNKKKNNNSNKESSISNSSKVSSNNTTS